jgi:hypothetical protein
METEEADVSKVVFDGRREVVLVYLNKNNEKLSPYPHF